MAGHADDADRGVFAWLRKGHDPARTLLVVVNFTPRSTATTASGCRSPARGARCSIRDAAVYGGSNVGNAGSVRTSDEMAPVPKSASLFRLLPPFSSSRIDRMRNVSAGSPHPLGANWDGRGTNFALFSANAPKVELCLFDGQGRRELERWRCRSEPRTSGTAISTTSRPGSSMATGCMVRMSRSSGLRFNPYKLLLDPYAKRARRTAGLERRPFRLSGRQPARRPGLRSPRQRARHAEGGG